MKENLLIKVNIYKDSSKFDLLNDLLNDLVIDSKSAKLSASAKIHYGVKLFT